MSRFAAYAVVGLIALSGIAAGASAKVVTVDVSTFGAIPGDGKDDTSAVRSALDECAKHKGARLVFPKGRYHFAADDFAKRTGVLFSINNVDGLTVDGQGSEFICHGVTGVFACGTSKDVTFRGFTIDWDRPPFSIGRVTGVQGRSFDVDVQPQYPITESMPVGAFMDYDEKTGLPVRHGLDEYNTVTSTEVIGPQKLRVNLNHDATIKAGSLAVLRHQVYSYNGFVAGKVTGLKIEDVTIYTVPGMGLYAGACTNVNLDRFNVKIKPGRLMSATADAVHLSGCKGDVRIRGCTFEGMGDDAANIKSGLFLTVKKIVDDHTVIAAHNLKMVDSPDPGDRMEFTRQEDLGVYATLPVKSVEVLPNDGLQRVAFVDRLPAGLKEGDLIGNATRVAKVRISDCTIGSNRARGFLIQNRDVVVENCRFRNCTSGGIWVLTEITYFYESIGSRDVVIRNNTFENCNYGGPLGETVLGVYAYLNGFKYPTTPGAHKRITLEGNTIRGSDNCAIFAAGVDDLVVRGNTIEGACSSPTHDVGHNAIYIQGSANIRIEGNTADPAKQGAGCGSIFTLGPGVAKSSVKVEGNKGF